jgi:glyoxylase-like metal-dependent hydrolase (beta-lactamase superfamily II)
MSTMRVRMYRQGLGDCFLLSFPKTDGNRCHVLIDFGVLSGTPGGDEKMRNVARNLVSETQGELDVLAVTHEHWDHCSGFVQARDILDPLQVDQVWLAWTERPGDKVAADLAAKRTKAHAAVVTAAEKLKNTGNPVIAQNAERLQGVLEFFGPLAATGRRTSAEAFAWVKSRPNAIYEFCEPGTQLRLPGVEGVRVYVLGPPRDTAMIAKSDPSARDSEVYPLADGIDYGFLAAVAAEESGTPLDDQPFANWFGIDEASSRAHEFYSGTYWHQNDEWRAIEHDWLNSADSLALRLDSDTNNTSLVLAFELIESGRILLFPGDAQVGNWLSWGGLKWTVAGPNGESRTISIDDLFARTVLYKVGHHGSHNATLRQRGLELMTHPDLVAMLPVERAVAAKQGATRKDGTRGWLMPRESLFQRLQDKTSGRIIDRDTGISETAQPGPTWDRFAARTDVQPGWIDYQIEL